MMKVWSYSLHLHNCIFIVWKFLRVFINIKQFAVSSLSAFQPVSSVPFKYSFAEVAFKATTAIESSWAGICETMTNMKISSKVSWLGKRWISLYTSFCGVLGWFVNNHSIWPMILSSGCFSLKLFIYSLDNQGKLAFIWSFSLISAPRPFLSLADLGDLLFSSPRPFDLRLWALVFITQKETDKERVRGLIVFKLYCAGHFLLIFLLLSV